MSYAPFHLPETLCADRYRLRRKLAEGTATALWEAQDTARDRNVAVKVLHPDAREDSRYRDRFLREARLLDKLQHPNIVRIYDVHLTPEHEFFTMELASESDLSSYLRRHGAITAIEALVCAFAVLRGLDFAHKAGVIHRDVKPSNVLITTTLDNAKLTDFGIARESDTQNPLTLAGDALGTVAYMAPEQCEDPRKAGPYSDVYSVGAMLYLLLSGRSPIDIADLAYDDSALQHVPGPTQELLVRSVHPDPGARFPNAREMANAVASSWMALDSGQAEHRPRIQALDDLAAPTTMQITTFATDEDDEVGGLLQD